jgi:rRNA-processing protein FCF1
MYFIVVADQPFTIRRKVVLLTEDRNLRLKAHVQNIPVVAVPQFLEMIVP